MARDNPRRNPAINYIQNNIYNPTFKVTYYDWTDDDEIIGLDPISLQTDLDVATDGQIRAFLRARH